MCSLVVVGVCSGSEAGDALRLVLNELSAQNHLSPSVIENPLKSKAPIAAIVSVPISPSSDFASSVEIVSPSKPIELAAGKIYAPELGAGLQLKQSRVYAVPFVNNQRNTPADQLLSSIAEHSGEFAVGVILSGEGTDGVIGLRAISDAGGMTMVQDAETADQCSMPRAAVAMGIVDHVLTPELIATEILNHAEHMQTAKEGDAANALNRQIIISIPQITAAIEKHTENDFKHYKTTTLTRRIKRRIHILKLANVDAYIDLLVSSRDEALHLFRELLISVTSFFRDPNAFASFQSTVLETLILKHQVDEPIRIWIPGCATGQEAYTIAILLHEALEKSSKTATVQIFATDLDERALAFARAGGYPVGIQDEVPPIYLKKYFTKRGNRFYVSKKIREMIVFSAHNLISDPPFTKLDCISCRNLLIYLGSHLQKKLIPLFHYSIKPGGYLFLGPAETLSVNKELFKTLNQKYRIFQRRLTAIDDREPIELPNMNLSRVSQSWNSEAGEVDLFRYAQRIVLGEFSPQWVVVDDEGEIQSLSSDPAPFLQLSAGKFKNNVIALAHEHLRIGLRSAFAEAKQTRRRSLAEDMSIPMDNGIQRVHITVQPMPDLGEGSSLHLIAFHRIGTPLRIDDDAALEQSKKKSAVMDVAASKVIEQLELELSRTRETLERTVQELESSNEELKSSNEELLSMNEEMQSANEELESSKEELQASNESLARNNDDIRNLLQSTKVATLFLDNDLKIRGFTPAVCDIYPLEETDVGRRISAFVPLVGTMPDIPNPIKDNGQDLIQDKIESIDGRTFLRRVMPYVGREGTQDGIVVTFNDVTELSESQTLFQLLTEASSQIVWTTDANGAVIEDSPSWREFTGQTINEWLGTGWLNAVHVDDRDGISSRWKHSVETGTVLEFEYRLLHRSGQYRWTLVRGVPQKRLDGTIRRWVGMNVDIHAKKEAEVRLKESESLTRTIAENSTLALIMMDASGFLTYCNHACLDMFGFSIDELKSRPLHDMIHHHRPDGTPYPIEECPIDRALPEDFSVRAHEDLFFRRDGSTLPVMCAASPIFRAGVPISTVIEVRDITEQKAFIRQIEERESHLRRILNGTLCFVGVLDHDGRLVEVNEPALIAGGVTREQVLGIPFSESYWWSFDQEVSQQIQEAIATVAAGNTFRSDLRYRVAHNEIRWVDFSLTPIVDKDGKVTHMVPSGMDVTQRYEIERELNKARATAESANLSKSAFLANMSHEIRTPMTAILGYADLIADKVTDAELSRYIATIRRNGEFLLEIINDILDLSKIEADKVELTIEDFSLVALLEDVRSIMQVRAFEKDIEVELKLSQHVPHLVRSDAKRLKQILVNLVGNAVKFTNQGKVSISVDYKNSHLMFVITDTGIGMSTEQIQRLFKPFSQADSNINRVYGGTGLGLAISKRLVEIMGGQISVESKLGVGSSFFLEIKMEASISQAEIPTATTMANLKGTTDENLFLDCSVLVVDDRRDIRHLSRTILTKAGANVSEAVDGEQAVEVIGKALTSQTPPDVVILDMQMPNLDGYETAKRLRQLGYTGPIIALTADAMQGDMSRCIEAGCNDYLSKPINAKEFLATVFRYSRTIKS